MTSAFAGSTCRKRRASGTRTATSRSASAWRVHRLRCPRRPASAGPPRADGRSLRAARRGVGVQPTCLGLGRRSWSVRRGLRKRPSWTFFLDAADRSRPRASCTADVLDRYGYWRDRAERARTGSLEGDHPAVGSATWPTRRRRLRCTSAPPAGDSQWGPVPWDTAGWGQPLTTMFAAGRCEAGRLPGERPGSRLASHAEPNPQALDPDLRTGVAEGCRSTGMDEYRRTSIDWKPHCCWRVPSQTRRAAASRGARRGSRPAADQGAEAHPRGKSMQPAPR